MSGLGEAPRIGRYGVRWASNEMYRHTEWQKTYLRTHHSVRGQCCVNMYKVRCLAVLRGFKGLLRSSVIKWFRRVAAQNGSRGAHVLINMPRERYVARVTNEPERPYGLSSSHTYMSSALLSSPLNVVALARTGVLHRCLGIEY